MTKFHVGDLVRHKKTDRTFILEDVNDNPNYKEDDEYFAMGWSSYGTEEVERKKDIELVMTAADASARKLPSARDILGDLNLTASGWGDDEVDIHTTELDGEALYAYGRAKNGLEVGFKLVVAEIWEGGDV